MPTNCASVMTHVCVTQPCASGIENQLPVLLVPVVDSYLRLNPASVAPTLRFSTAVIWIGTVSYDRKFGLTVKLCADDVLQSRAASPFTVVLTSVAQGWRPFCTSGASSEIADAWLKSPRHGNGF